MTSDRDDIVTDYDPKPIPIREYDWCAYIDGCEEGPVGYGPSRHLAVTDLLELLEGHGV